MATTSPSSILNDIAVDVGRVILVIALIADVAANITTYTIFNNKLELISTPSLLLVTLVLLLVAAYFQFRKVPNPTIANSILLITVVVGLVGFLFRDSYAYYEAPGLIVLLILLSVIMLPWQMTPVIGAVYFAVLAILAQTQYPVWVLTQPGIDTPGVVLVRNGLILFVAVIGGAYFRYKLQHAKLQGREKTT